MRRFILLLSMTAVIAMAGVACADAPDVSVTKSGNQTGDAACVTGAGYLYGIVVSQQMGQIP